MKGDKTMNVLIVEPEKAPREAEISGGLKSMQEVVGGMIQAVYPYDDPVALVCNDEGKILGMPLNRKLDDYDIIAGTFIICGLSEDDFTSLPPDLMEKYQKKFEQPEVFMKLGSHIISIPMELQEEVNPLKLDHKLSRDER